MDTNEAKKVCGFVEPLEGPAQRAIADHIERLEDWKSQASRVLGGLQLQEIAKEIGLRWGDDIGPAILPWIRNQKAQVHKVPMAPHTFAQMVNRVRDLAFDFGTTEQFRDRVSELLGAYVDDRVPERRAVEESGPTPDYTGEGSAWVPPVEAQAVAVPEISFAKIELGFGRVEVGEGTWMDAPALIFGKKGNGVVGKPTEAGNRFLGVDECLAVVTFANVESLDVVLGKLMKCRSDRFPDAIPADRALGEPKPLACAPKDRPILAFWECSTGRVSDVVRCHLGRFVNWVEWIEHEGDGGYLFSAAPQEAEWIELPNFTDLRASQG